MYFTLTPCKICGFVFILNCIFNFYTSPLKNLKFKKNYSIVISYFHFLTASIGSTSFCFFVESFSATSIGSTLSGLLVETFICYFNKPVSHRIWNDSLPLERVLPILLMRQHKGTYRRDKVCPKGTQETPHYGTRQGDREPRSYRFTHSQFPYYDYQQIYWHGRHMY